MNNKLSKELLQIPDPNFESEKAVLMSAILDDQNRSSIVAELQSSYFCNQDYAAVAGYMIALQSRLGKFDRALLIDELKTKNIPSLSRLIVELTRDSLADHHNWQAHLGIIRDTHERRLRHTDLIADLKNNQSGALSSNRKLRDAKSNPSPNVICMADIEPQEITWLWYGRIALGKVTLFSGDPGLGKSFVTLDIATRVSNGSAWADSSGNAPSGSVLILNSEDGAADTMRPRLDQMGANVNSIHILHAIKHGEQDRTFSLVADMAHLEQAANQIENCKLIIIDPISSYLAGVDGNKSSEVRVALDPLKGLAERTGAAVLLVNHLNKGTGAAIYRSSGSISIIGMARSAWAFARDKDNPDRRLMFSVKTNIARDIGGLAFSIIGGAVIWEPEPIDISADDALAFEPKRSGRNAGALDQAKQLLQELLANGSKVKQTDIEAAAQKAGISESTLRRAKTAMRVESDKNGFEGGWQWWLPVTFPTWDGARRRYSIQSKLSIFDRAA